MSEAPLLNAETLDDLANVIGAERLDLLVARFEVALSNALTSVVHDPGAVGREAHTLISMAGMLGCDAFCTACRTLEYAVKDGTDISAALAEARRVRDATIDSLNSRRERARTG